MYGGQQGNPHQQQMRGMAGGTQQPWDYLNDPVLLSYWRCLSNDILCVWRRIPSASSASSPGGSSAFPPSFPSGFPNPQSSTQQGSNGLSTLSGAKELWIFWYGDTSPDLSSLVVPEILNMEGEHGSWENGLSYECRSLLFKALHNLIERSVLWFFSFCLVQNVTICYGCAGVCCQEISSDWASGLCSHRKEWILPALNNSKTSNRIPPTLQPPFQPGTVTCRFHFRFSSTESRLFAPASTSVNTQSYARPPTGI